MACKDIEPVRGSLTGELRVPGDKSIAQRAILLAAAAEGESRIAGLPDSQDVASALAAARQVGARVEREGDGIASIQGWGGAGPCLLEGETIECGNSATLARLLMGLLAGYPGEYTFSGDESLQARPFDRVLDPLSRMGVHADSNHLPLILMGSDSLHAIDFEQEVASAQVKSAILLAGLRAEGTTRVFESITTRAHTEALLPLFGANVDAQTTEHGTAISLAGPQTLKAIDLDIPADPSSAAYAAALALLVPESAVMLRDLNLDPARLGFYRALALMGAVVTVEQIGMRAGQPCGSIAVEYSADLAPIHIASAEVPSLIDELPLLMLLAAFANGTSSFEGISELHVKETDRIAVLCAGFDALGIRYAVEGDDMRIDGGFTPPSGCVQLESDGDHRMALTWAVLGLSGVVSASVADFDCIKVSYPQFLTDIEGLCS